MFASLDPKHIFLISCFTDDGCFLFKKNIIIEFSEKFPKRDQSSFYYS